MNHPEGIPEEADFLNPDYEAALRADCGDDLFEEIQRLASGMRSAFESADSIGNRPNVLILPGIFGSTLSRPSFPFPDKVWLDVGDIVLGGLRKLVPVDDTNGVYASGVILSAYILLRTKLRASGVNADFMPYDWRRSPMDLGQSLFRHLRKAGMKDTTLVCHSMGGLVARAAAALDVDRRFVARVVTIGTPNLGSFKPVEVFRLEGKRFHLLAGLDIYHSAHELVDKVATRFPGLIEMMPHPGTTEINFFDVAAWPKGSVPPDQTALARAEAAARALAPVDDRFTQIIGTGHDTIQSARRVDDRFAYSTSADGDGTVPRKFAEQGDVPRYFVDGLHPQLCNNREVINIVRAIVHGETPAAPETAPARLAERERSSAEQKRIIAAASKQAQQPVSAGLIFSEGDGVGFVPDPALPDSVMRVPDAPRARVQYDAAPDPSLQGEATGIAAPDLLIKLRRDARQAEGRVTQCCHHALCHDPVMRQAWDDYEYLTNTIERDESPERIRNRLAYSHYSSAASLERIMGDDNLEEAFMLDRAVRVKRSTARLHVRQPGGGGWFGTCFLVAPNLMLTNNHVLGARHMADRALVTFDFENLDDWRQRPVCEFRATRDVFLTSERLDYTFFSVESASACGRSLSEFAVIPLLPLSGKALKREYVNIIQHPGGRSKKVAQRENAVIGRRGDFLYYTADTDAGSSGAAVMSIEWQVAALHHMAVPDRRQPGRYIANRGVRISSILADIDLRKASGEQAADDVFRAVNHARLASVWDSPGTAVPTGPTDTPDIPAEQGIAENIDQVGETVTIRDRQERAGQESLGRAYWPTDHRNAPDTWHLPHPATSQPFVLNGDVIRDVIRAGHFSPVIGDHNKIILALRGCKLADDAGSVTGASEAALVAVRPDHENFRCLIGTFDTATGLISLFLGSTVPRHTGMRRFANGGARCNMLPTGCYEYCVGTHYSARSSGPAAKVEYVLRLGDGPVPANAGPATVLRTTNDLAYGTRDMWDKTKPADNIHPAFLAHSFSSLGCLTLRGTQTHNGSYDTGTGEWRQFRRAAGFDGQRRGERYDTIVITGHEAQVIAGQTDAAAPICLRQGSRGERVRTLQSFLGIGVDGDFGAGTCLALVRLQRDRLGYATGTWSPAMAAEFGVSF